MKTTRIVALGVALALSTSCGSCQKTDAERAAEERAAIKEKLTDSWELAPYIWLKVAIRSNADPEVVGPLQDVSAALEETEELHADAEGAKRVAKLTVAYGKLGVAILKAKSELAKHDEDTFPLLWEIWTGEPPPTAWYDNGVEHLALSLIWIGAGVAVKDLEERSFVYYELSRAEVSESWPLPLQLLGWLTRGFAFTNAGYHFAAEEELTRYIDRVEALSPAEQTSMGVAPLRESETIADLEPKDVVEIARAAGYFVRAWNRMGLDRNEQAVDDVEKGLAALEAMGIENELTQWGWTFVHVHRGRNEKAGQVLGRLAESPYLDEDTKSDLRESAEKLQKQGDAEGFFSVLGKGRAALVISQALLARAGGIRGILEALLGEEQAAPIVARIDWLGDTRAGVTEAISVKGGVDAVKSLGGKGIDLGKKLLEDQLKDDAEAD